MYLGCIVEKTSRDLLFERPLHPYTQMLLSATPSLHPDPSKPRIRIQGELPNPLDPPPGCVFHRRCPYATEKCKTEVPALRNVEARQVACHYAENFL